MRQGRCALTMCAVLTTASMSYGLVWKAMPETSPSLHTTGVRMVITLKDPVPAKVLVDHVGIDGLSKDGLQAKWRAEVVTGGQKRVEVTLTAKDFKFLEPNVVPTRSVPFCYLARYVLTIDGTKDDGIAAVDVQWVNDDKTPLPWEITPESTKDDAGRVWWPGASKNNAGHFGWRYEPNGLLTCNASFNCIETSWFYLKPNGEAVQFNFKIPDAIEAGKEIVAKADNEKRTGEVTNWTGLATQLEYKVDRGAYEKDKIDADWTTMRWRRTIQTHAGKEYFQELRYSMLGVGVQVESDSPEMAFSFQSGKDTRGPAGVTLIDGSGTHVVKTGQTIDFKQMKQNWVILLNHDGTIEMPVMIVFQHRPESLTWSKDQCVIRWPKAMGTVAIGMPFGVQPLPANVLDEWAARPASVSTKTMNTFAELLMALPWTCTETFAVIDDAVRIRQSVTFWPWNDEWNHSPTGAVPIPPLVAYAMEKGLIPKSSAPGAVDMHIPTKWGAFLAKRGDSVEYTLPVPTLWDTLPLKNTPEQANQGLFEKLEKSLSRSQIELHFGGCTDPTAIEPGNFPHYAAHDFVCGAWRASTYMTAENLTYLRPRAMNRVRGALLPQSYQYRKDPVTGAQYVACTSWGGYYGPAYEVNGEGIGDIDYWQGLTIYGLYTQAKYNNDWATMAKSWPTIRMMLSYWEATHSWAMMSPGAREAGELYHGDMVTAGYAGLVGFHKLAARLGSSYERDLSAYLLAKATVPMISKLGFGPYMRAYAMNACWNPMATGFGERWGASMQNPSLEKRGMEPNDPWWVTGCIGPQSAQAETMDLYIKYCYRDALDFERTLQKLCPDAGFATHDDVRVMPHMMLRAFLGGEMASNAVTVLRGYLSQYLLRDSHVVANALSVDCPVRLEDWYPAIIESAEWSDKTGATIVFNASAAGTIRLTIRSDLTSPTISIDGQSVQVKSLDSWRKWHRVEVVIPQGRHTLTIGPAESTATTTSSPTTN